MNSLLVILPLPPKELSPNARSHWRAKAKAVADYRYQAAVEAQVAARQLDNVDWLPLSKAVISVTYYHKTAAFQDADNILSSLKSAFDGMVTAGILTDDRDVTYPPVFRLKDKDNPRVELIISPATMRQKPYINEEIQ